MSQYYQSTVLIFINFHIIFLTFCGFLNASQDSFSSFAETQIDSVELPNDVGQLLVESQENSIHRKDYVDSVNIIGEQLTQKILSFSTLSPSLLRAITASFLILHNYNPALLENGSYLEFGLYKGFSLWFAQQIGKMFAQYNFHYFGFDSFAGLSPFDNFTGSGWKAGDYACSVQEVENFLCRYNADFSSLHLIEGWYGQNLFIAHFPEYGQYKPAIITIDSDTYESAKAILTFFLPLAQPGTIILFDEFMVNANENQIQLNEREDTVNHSGERRALIEFLDNNSEYQFVSLFPFSEYGYAFMIMRCPNGVLDEKIRISVEQMIGNSKPPEVFKTWSSHITGRAHQNTKSRLASIPLQLRE